ncbi:MAG: nicotinate phosphoribosyltransferase [Deltaproteobacteria bacterium]|nr:nicotinate phosphoribosyltransferase [Deltaproteobacteria bacterium]OQX63002.1 MAG: nicotinate phosphoribosyltransferase [Desulfococcus sp. 4484_242]
MFDTTAIYTDQYELVMAQAYFLAGRKDESAVFDYFYRKNPFNGGYAIFAGLPDLLGVLENYRFNEEDLAFLSTQSFHPDYLSYLKSFRFTGTVYSPPEGEVVFPTRPILRVEGNLIETQLIETVLLNILNFESLIATKASRIRLVAGNRTLIDFGLRRAQGLGGYYASRAAVIGGFDGTSNVLAARDYGLKASGTMAHSFVQSHENEIDAFRAFAASRPNDSVLLVDTYNTLKNGIPNAITVAKEMEKRGHRLRGIRMDSGDLAYLARKARAMLDEAGLHYVKITVSNQLDEYVIRSLMAQGAPIDGFGVGTNLITGHPDAALDGVYKLAQTDGRPVIKLSENISKITLPAKKQVWRAIDDEGLFLGADVVGLEDEKAIPVMHHPFVPHQSFAIEPYETEPQLHLMMARGKVVYDPPSLAQTAQRVRERLEMLPMEYKRFENPHIYKVGISGDLKSLRDRLIAQYKR